jgi:2-polyprenyl-3-methyl-5-hydroxy-6-metoxy-1,4-benzoquinol methylase
MSTGSHNKFIFDFDNRSFIGDFEEMYQSEERESFDSWQQDQMSKYKKIDLVILGEYNFKTILDIGCGKGFFTSLLKKKNNIVAGVDISQRAVEIAKQKYPELMFSQLDVNKSNALDEFCHEFMAGGG